MCSRELYNYSFVEPVEVVDFCRLPLLCALKLKLLIFVEAVERAESSWRAPVLLNLLLKLLIATLCALENSI